MHIHTRQMVTDYISKTISIQLHSTKQSYASELTIMSVGRIILQEQVTIGIGGIPNSPTFNCSSYGLQICYNILFG